VCAHVVGERPGDREVAAERSPVGLALVQRSEPARAEVDRVQGQQVVGHVGRLALQVVAFGIERRGRTRLDLRDGVQVDPHLTGARGDPRAAGANLTGQ
jgi:hypothetical protein